MWKNMIDYVRDSAALTFETKPFCGADSIVLSQLAYFHFGEVIPSEEKPRGALRLLEAIALTGIRSLVVDTFIPAKNEKLLLAILESARFREIKTYAHVSELDKANQMQFSAISFLLPTGMTYVAFRGTDASLVGWKEDLNMAFLSSVPAQEAAVRYLDRVAKGCNGTLMTGGHSKGGNLALYAALKCAPEVRKRLRSVYSHDGPGFRENLLADSAFQAISGMVQTTIPRDSVVGMLLQHDTRYRVVECASIGLFQHDLFTWGIEHGDLLYAGQLSTPSVILAKSLDDWLSAVEPARRERFVEVLFQVVEATRLDNVNELPKHWRKAATEAVKAVKDIDEDTRNFLFEIFKLFMDAVKDNVRVEMQQKISEMVPTVGKGESEGAGA